MRNAGTQFDPAVSRPSRPPPVGAISCRASPGRSRAADAAGTGTAAERWQSGAAQRGRHRWMMSRIEMMPATWPFSITTRWRKPPFAIASAAFSRSQSASANVARDVR